MAAGGDAMGLWTPEEDDLLAQTVSVHKDGNWSTIAIKSGLRRSGKSCRLRFVKHLSSKVKNGPLDLTEQQVVIELQVCFLRTHRIPLGAQNEITAYSTLRCTAAQQALATPGLPLPETPLAGGLLQRAAFSHSVHHHHHRSGTSSAAVAATSLQQGLARAFTPAPTSSLQQHDEGSELVFPQLEGPSPRYLQEGTPSFNSQPYLVARRLSGPHTGLIPPSMAATPSAGSLAPPPLPSSNVQGSGSGVLAAAMWKPVSAQQPQQSRPPQQLPTGPTQHVWEPMSGTAWQATPTSPEHLLEGSLQELSWSSHLLNYLSTRSPMSPAPSPMLPAAGPVLPMPPPLPLLVGNYRLEELEAITTPRSATWPCPSSGSVSSSSTPTTAQPGRAAESSQAATPMSLYQQRTHDREGISVAVPPSSLESQLLAQQGLAEGGNGSGAGLPGSAFTLLDGSPSPGLATMLCSPSMLIWEPGNLLQLSPHLDFQLQALPDLQHLPTEQTMQPLQHPLLFPKPHQQLRPPSSSRPAHLLKRKEHDDIPGPKAAKIGDEAFVKSTKALVVEDK
eukprot:SM000166S02473  [mRNA]  locus=s166:113299:116784:- [translate_table: standard]